MCPVSCSSLSAHVEVMTHLYRNVAAAKRPGLVIQWGSKSGELRLLLTM